MRRTNINAVLKMVKQFLNGEMDTTSFWLDFPYEVTERWDKMCRENSEWAEMIQFYLVECGTDQYDHLNEEDFYALIKKQYNEVMRGPY